MQGFSVGPKRVAFLVLRWQVTGAFPVELCRYNALGKLVAKVPVCNKLFSSIPEKRPQRYG